MGRRPPAAAPRASRAIVGRLAPGGSVGDTAGAGVMAAAPRAAQGV